MNLLLFLLLTFSATPLQNFFSGTYLVIWNVGQGQWATQITPERCQHFDMGGEFFPWKKLHQACGDKTNEIYLSHWDWDHIGALSKPALRRTLGHRCLALAPDGPASKYKKSLLANLSSCSARDSDLKIWTPFTAEKDSNARSHVLLHREVLLPGDSPQKQEVLWSQLPWVRTARVVVLGHHGSRTSSSEQLFRALPRVRLTIASARWARYRHPHPQVLERLRQHHLPLLRTEDWGNIWLEGPEHPTTSGK
ncbi:hydrolase [Bdellovibrio bacteriovorus]|uniref:ComEC/Rec2 family competence protein n=1 Tax=Bdellovibrio bacteriovorus TaxID=959 RepID=UPI0021CF1EFD|nr:hydrolase [Bdellovibrio bacteriovorus]UXR63145.1 hydrolase [Bdellovibrio bacteriovorus]